MRMIKAACIFICLGLTSCATAQTSNQATVTTDSIADKMLIYQLSNGAWPKQLIGGNVVKYEMPIDDALMAKIKGTTMMHATIDNAATTREINALIKAYQTTKNKKYLLAAEKGIDYLLKAQYDNGGWPQYYPDKSSYRAEITYNDNAIVNVLNIMFDITHQTNGFDAVNQQYRSKAAISYQKGVDCILKTQVIQHGKLSIWAAQYDQNTLKPAKARSFEPASLSTSESVNIIKFLMKIKDPSPAIRTAIAQGVNWFENAKISGYKFDKLPNGDRGLIADPTAIIWARFYDFETNKPIFGDRDNTIKSDVAAISFERRNGYSWYGNWGVNLLTKEYPKWLKANP